jgi:hypothetical protein
MTSPAGCFGLIACSELHFAATRMKVAKPIQRCILDVQSSTHDAQMRLNDARCPSMRDCPSLMRDCASGIDDGLP